jgi:hypothetical protein
MALTKAFDRINTAADKAYLAHCTCHGDVCQCNHDDGQNSFHASNSNKDSKMPDTIIERMTAAQRQDLAAKIEAANDHLTHDERRDLIDTLSVGLGVDLKAKAAADKKHNILVRIHAAENDVVHGGKVEIERMNQILRAKGVSETVQELAFKSVKEIDAIFAAAKPRLNSTDSLAAKRVIGRLGGLTY